MLRVSENLKKLYGCVRLRIFGACGLERERVRFLLLIILDHLEVSGPERF